MIRQNVQNVNAQDRETGIRTAMRSCYLVVVNFIFSVI